MSDESVLSDLQRGETALHMAARAGQVEVVRCLLRNGAMVDARARVRPPSPVLPQRRYQRRALTTCVPPGGPDATSHRVPPGEDGDRAAAAAAHGSPRRSHHQRVHPPPHLRPGGPAGDRLRPDGGRSVPLTSHQGQDGGRVGGGVAAETDGVEENVVLPPYRHHHETVHQFLWWVT